jgi:hypothetical protein
MVAFLGNFWRVGSVRNWGISISGRQSLATCGKGATIKVNSEVKQGGREYKKYKIEENERKRSKYRDNTHNDI